MLVAAAITGCIIAIDSWYGGMDRLVEKDVLGIVINIAIPAVVLGRASGS